VCSSDLANPQDDKPPRGALIVVAIGLVACVVAALATVGKGEGESAHLEWVQLGTAQDSKTTPVPGGKGTMQLLDTNIRATGTNVSGYSLYIVSTIFNVSAGAPIADSSVLCAIKAPKETEVAQSGGDLRATYPRSSESGIYSQEVPETVLMDFSSHGGELASLEVPDRPQRFTTEKGVKVEWPSFKIGEERMSTSSPASRSRTWSSRSSRSGEPPPSPRRKSAARWKPAPGKRPRASRPPSRTARRRSTKKPKS